MTGPPPGVGPVTLAERFRLDGQSFAVVGAGAGIGADTCRAVAALGGRLLCVDVDERRACRIGAEVGGVTCVADVTGPAGVDCVANAARAMGGLNGFVDIVGMTSPAPLTAMADADYERDLRYNLTHAFLLLRAAPDFVTRGPNRSLVFISSNLGLTGAPRQAVYGAAKSAVISLVRTAAVELAPMRVNSIAPGTTGTPWVRAQLSPGATALFDANVPRGSIAEPYEIATSAAFLLSLAASYITGQTIVADGGVSAKSGFPDLPDQ